MQVDTTGVDDGPRAGAREWLGLAVLTVPCLIYAMDMTVLYLAVPQITEHLRPSASELLWIVDIYGFMVAGFLIVMGTLGDRIGRRRLLMIGGVAFGVSSALCAFAQTPEWLIVGRAIQGIAGATLAPSTLALITNMFRNARDRTFAIGVWVAAFSSGAALGPLLGGVLLEHFWWGAVLLINLPIMLCLVPAMPFLLPEYRAEKSAAIDLTSALQSLISTLLIMYALKGLAADGLSAQVVVAALIGFAGLVLFLRRQKALAHPLIDLKVFTIPNVSAALTINVLGLFTILGTFLFIAQYLQLVLEMGPLEAGLWTAPSGIVFALGSVATPYLLRRYSPFTVVACGLLLAAIGFTLLAFIRIGDGPYLLFVAMLIFCAGLAPVATTTTDIVMAAAPPERAGSISAISETSFEFGGAAGIAVFGSLLVAIYRGELSALTPDGGLTRESIDMAGQTLGGAMEAARALGGDGGRRLAAAAQHAFVSGMQATALLAASTSLGACAMTLALRRQQQKIVTPV